MTEKRAPLSKKEDDLVLLNCQEYPGLLLLNVRNPSLDMRPQDLSSGSHLASSTNGDEDSVTSSDCPYREDRVLEGAGAVSWAAPLMDTLT
jgi:hypothetical protein